MYVLIENKLDTTFQEEQYNRYLKRAIKYTESKDCDKAFTILVAPELYCESQNEFENYITYEAIARRLEFTGTKRNLFTSELLQIAIEKSRRGYQAVNSIPVQKFWYAYWQYKEANHPCLKMKEPGIVPHNSDWPILHDDKLKNISFYHKLRQGNVDATFYNYSEEQEFKIEKYFQLGPN